MALVVNDRVKETSTTTGTGTFTLDGAVTGFETFSSAIGNSNTTYYAIEIPNSTEFEVGLGTVSAGQLARTQVFSSSNSDALVNFSAGTKNVFCTLPASKAVIEDASNNVTLPADLTVDTNTLYVDSSNNAVGINTTSPGTSNELLIVASPSDGTKQAQLTLQGNAGQTLTLKSVRNGVAAEIASFYDLDIKSGNSPLGLWTNGSERMTIDSSGNVGIGTTNPSTLLHLSSSDPQITITDTDGTGSQVIKAVGDDLQFDVVGKTVIDSDSGGTLQLLDGGTSYLKFFKFGTYAALESMISDDDFKIRGNDGGAYFDALTLDMSEAGNATFNGDVTVENYLRIDNSGSEVLNITGETTYGTLSVGNRTLNLLANATIFLDDQFNEVMRMHSNGNIGIGTTNPSATLDVDGSAIFNESGAAVDFRVEGDTNANLFFVDGSTDRIGIGTSSPGTALHMRIDGGDANLLLERSTAGVTSKWGIKPYNDKLHFRDESVNPIIDNFTMTSDGYFGIGTTSPSSLLHLSSSDPQITITDTDGSGSQIIKAVGDDFTIDAAANITLDVGGANGINLYNDNGPKGLIYFLSDNLNIKPTQSDTDLVIKGNDGGAEITALTLDMSEAGAATFNSSVTVGANLDVSSGTIKLDGNYPTGTNNVAMGDTALDSIGTGGAGHNVAIGHAALTADNTGTGNVGIGAFALTSTVTGNYSTAIGQEALKVNTASWNNAIGFQSMLTSVGGEKNIAMGFWSLKNLGSNDKNVAIGHEAGINLTGGDNNIIIGHNAQAASATTSNQITLGDSNVTSFRIPGLQSGASSGDVLTYDGTDITLSAPTGVSAGFVIAMSIAL